MEKASTMVALIAATILCSAPVVSSATFSIVISELMINPQKVSKAKGTWFELYNKNNQSYSLADCSVYIGRYNASYPGNTNGQKFAFPANAAVPANGYFTFGKNNNTATNGNVTIDVQLDSLPDLDESGAEVAITKAGVPDSIAWVFWGNMGYYDFPFVAGASLNVKYAVSGYFDEHYLYKPSNWCASVTTYGNGDKGSPKAADSCTVASPTRAPTKRPTLTPTKRPTKPPTKPPTKTPTKPPTKTPTRRPTKTPTRRPTKAPIKPPTDRPTKAPLTKHPMGMQTRIPTRAPVSPPVPVVAPTQAPVNAPMIAPTNAPVLVTAPTMALTMAPTTTKAPATAPVSTNAPVLVKAPTMAPAKVTTKAPVTAPANLPILGAAPSVTPASPSTNAPATASPLTNTPVLLKAPTVAPTKPSTRAPPTVTAAPANDPVLLKAPTVAPAKTTTKGPAALAPVNMPVLIKAPTSAPTKAPTKMTGGSKKCGILGLRIFCPRTRCGLGGRVLGLCKS
jgi:hypothetical protein